MAPGGMQYLPVQPCFRTVMDGQNRLFSGQVNSSGQACGIVRVIDNNYGIYEGQFSNNNFHGFGRHISFEGEYYIGWFLNGARSSFGKCVDAHGNIREGDWQ